jgi:hypothetical protein
MSSRRYVYNVTIRHGVRMEKHPISGDFSENSARGMRATDALSGQNWHSCHTFE